MALCVYKRIRSDPIRININGQYLNVQRGQTVVVDNKYMMGVPGFAFLGLYEQRDQPRMNNQNLTIRHSQPIMETVSPEDSLSLPNVQRINITMPESKPILEEVQVVDISQEVGKKINTDGFSKETLETLKKYNNKQWFSLKKEEIIKFLDDAGVEYNHISSDKWELLKFLKKIIKEL
jgi:hypothetical protein